MHLMVILEDRISEWEAKGEILDGYFNPAGVFDTVTVLGLVEDQPEDLMIARLCAPARHRYVNVGIDRRGLMTATFGLRPGRLETRLARLISDLLSDPPDLVRAYGDGLAAVAAAVVGREAQIPYAVSLHTTPDPHIQSQYVGARDRLWRRLLAPSVHQALRGAGAVMAVYAPIRDYLPPDIAERTVVVPNVVGVTARPTVSERYGVPMRALWLGRQMPGRDPGPIIAALKVTPNVELTLIGDGPLHDTAQRAAEEGGVGRRTSFIRAMDNRELCASLPRYDVLVVNSAFREMPKTVMEAALSGLPIIVNRLPAVESPEYASLHVLFVDGNSGAYASALRDLEGNPRKRVAFAQETQDAAWRMWDPDRVATQTADILRALAERAD
ncbi:MAG: glycosyltransferase [Proteobacteria bacterium]|nr:glycosyltransferase [Pseudomonadota bacterium]